MREMVGVRVSASERAEKAHSLLYKESTQQIQLYQIKSQTEGWSRIHSVHFDTFMTQLDFQMIEMVNKRKEVTEM